MTACGPCKAEDVICPVCKKQCGTLLDKVVGTQHYHLDCFICNQCKCYLGGQKFYRDPREKGMLLCGDCKDSVCSGTHTRLTHGGVETESTEPGKTGYVVHKPVIYPLGSSKCRRCGKTVYENEKLRVCESLWHRAWFAPPPPIAASFHCALRGSRAVCPAACQLHVRDVRQEARGLALRDAAQHAVLPRVLCQDPPLSACLF